MNNRKEQAESIESLQSKIKKHRRKVMLISLCIVVCILFISVTVIYISQKRVYRDYQILNSVEREDTSGTQFVEFKGNILKYNKDGIFYLDTKNKLIWNQTYEMQNPMIDICENYVVAADKQGKIVYIMNGEGLCGQVTVNMPIQQVHVAYQGMVAILMEQNGTGYIQLYELDGTFLAEGELHAKNSGYPMDIAISKDGKKLAVTMLDVNSASIKTTVAFYNFSSVGQNEIDNIVSSYHYENTVISKIEFLGNNTAVAIGGNVVYVYEGNEKPEQTAEVEIAEEIQSIFYNKKYIGLVVKSGVKEKPYQLKVYDTKGKEMFTYGFTMEYDKVEFLKNGEVCIYNATECSLINHLGKERFYYEFEKKLHKVIALENRDYIFIMDGETRVVRLQ